MNTVYEINLTQPTARYQIESGTFTASYLINIGVVQTGTVTSVGIIATSDINVVGSPITTDGTIALSLNYGSVAGTVCAGNDPRLSDSRTPTAHSHGSISNTGTIGGTAGLPLITTTGGLVTTGSFGTAPGTFAAGNHSHTPAELGAVPATLTITAGTGLTGGGDLSANRTLSVNFGNAAGTVCQGNDARLSDQRVPTDNSVTSAKIVDGTIVNADINASAAIARTKIEGTPPPSSRTISAGTGLTGGGDLSANRTLSVSFGAIAGTVAEGNHTHTWNSLTGTADVVPFTTTNGGPNAMGELAWDIDEETLALQLKSGVILQLGEETLYHVENNTGSTITKGAPVAYAGTVGASGKIRVKPWNGSTDQPLAFMGLATADIAHEGTGYVTHFGKVRGVNTSAFSAGAILYANPAGTGLTATEPIANDYVIVAVVINSHATNGTLLVRPTVASIPETPVMEGVVVANELILDLIHRNKVVTIDNVADVDVYIPATTAVIFPPNSFITLIQVGAGKIKLSGDAGVFINGFEDGKNSAGQNSALQIITTAPDVWYVVGGVE
jgi:hypothetical protein